MRRAALPSLRFSHCVALRTSALVLRPARRGAARRSACGSPLRLQLCIRIRIRNSQLLRASRASRRDAECLRRLLRSSSPPPSPSPALFSSLLLSSPSPLPPPSRTRTRCRCRSRSRSARSSECEQQQQPPPPPHELDFPLPLLLLGSSAQLSAPLSVRRAPHECTRVRILLLLLEGILLVASRRVASVSHCVF